MYGSINFQILNKLGSPIEISKYEIVESSQNLRINQYLNLRKFNFLNVEWHNSIYTIENDSRYFNVILGHEYLDALPFRAFKLIKEGYWKEIIIKSDVDQEFKYHLSDLDLEDQMALNNFDIHDLQIPLGSTIELSPESMDTVKYIVENFLQTHLDAAIFIDYDKNYPFVYRSTFRVFIFYSIRDIKTIKYTVPSIIKIKTLGKWTLLQT